MIMCIHIHTYAHILYRPFYVYIDTYISGFTFYLFQVGASNYSFQIQVTDARGCPVKFICFKISAIRLHMHTYINGHIYNSGAWARKCYAHLSLVIAISIAIGLAYE